ncbi:hypothetical protein GBA52_027210 [Prunus armeniaca]|nr:hypothetical protein GBA52_027210 [Prunus armeniaca]
MHAYSSQRSVLPIMDYPQLTNLALNLKDACSSFGCSRMAIACGELRDASEAKKNKERVIRFLTCSLIITKCLMVLEHIRREYAVLQKNLNQIAQKTFRPHKQSDYKRIWAKAIQSKSNIGLGSGRVWFHPSNLHSYTRISKNMNKKPSTNKQTIVKFMKVWNEKPDQRHAKLMPLES